MYQHQGDVDRGQPVQLGQQRGDEVGQHQVKPAEVSQHSHDRYVRREKETISAGQKIGVSVKQRKAQEDIGQVSYQVNLSQEATPPEQMTDQEDYLVWIAGGARMDAVRDQVDPQLGQCVSQSQEQHLKVEVQALLTNHPRSLFPKLVMSTAVPSRIHRVGSPVPHRSVQELELARKVDMAALSSSHNMIVGRKRSHQFGSDKKFQDLEKQQ